MISANAAEAWIQSCWADNCCRMHEVGEKHGVALLEHGVSRSKIETKLFS